MISSRKENSKRNVISGLVNRLVMILMPFINRTVILHIMSTDYLGLTSLFSSILEVLNLAELGFNTAVVYCMYKPMAKGDENKLIFYISLFKKIYFYVGMIIFFSGLSILPFINFFIKGNYPTDINIYLLFFMYLVNTSISYVLFAYKEVLLLADQRQNVINNLRTTINIVRYIVQFFVLLILKNFYIYVSIQIVSTIISNILLNKITERIYPNIIPIRIRKLRLPTDLLHQSSALLINRICDTFRNSLDNIIMSSMYGLLLTTIYSNYYFIYSSLYMVMLVIANGLGASIGNSLATESSNKNFSDLRKIQFIYSFLCIMATTCLLVLYQPFMLIWAGDKLMLDQFNMILFCVYFYLINLCNIRNQYINGIGMWWKLKFSYILEALANLLLNLILGKIFGISGVLFATIFTIFTFNYLYRTHMLFTTYFNRQEEIKYTLDQISYAVVCVLSCVITWMLCSYINLDGIFALIIYGCFAVLISASIFYLFYCWTDLFKQSKKLLL